MQAARRVAQWHDALGKEHKAVFVKRLFDAGGPLHFPVPRTHRQISVEPGMHTVAPRLLGRVARRVGRLQDSLGHGPALVDRYQTDAGANTETPAIVDEAEVVHAVADLLRHALRLLGGAVFQNDAELVATQARQRVAVAHRGRQQFGHLLQQLVAHRMPAGIVDQFELVEVDIHQGVRAVILVRFLQGAAQPGFELGAVDEPGQRIVRGPETHLARQPALLGDVVKHEYGAQHFAPVVADRGRGIFNAKLVAIAGNQHGVFGQPHHFGLGQAAVHRAFGGLAGLRMNDMEYLLQGPSPGLLRGPASHAFGHRIEPDDMPFAVRRDHGVADGLQGDAQQLVLLGQVVRQPPPLGHVLERADQPHRDAVREFHRPYCPHPDRTTISPNQPQLQVPAQAFGNTALHRALDHGSRLGRIKVDRLLQRRLVAVLHAMDTAGFVGPENFACQQIDLPATDAGQLAGAVQEDLALAQALFAGCQALLRLVLLGHVLHRSDAANDGIVRPDNRNRTAVQPAGNAVRPNDGKLQLNFLALRSDALPVLEQPVPVQRFQRLGPSVLQALRQCQPVDVLPAPVGVATGALGVGVEDAMWRPVAEGPEPGLAGGQVACCALGNHGRMAPFHGTSRNQR